LGEDHNAITQQAGILNTAEVSQTGRQQSLVQQDGRRNNTTIHQAGQANQTIASQLSRYK